ncbi:hypothetical protein [Sphingosinicella terrae]|uniref:hypothetical protein n=1 Tax=Sphingosinicella terrae TaxID=2172047 RepID=UPI000E0D9F00|nr:hypothetical protein [Sphingosinicella terrae]
MIKSMPLRLMTVFSAVALAVPAAGQAVRGDVDQIGENRASAVVGQIATESAPTAPAAPIEPQPTGPVTQISGTGESRDALPQLTHEDEPMPSPSQLYQGGRTALPSAPLSRPSEGRTSAVARVEGADRCDPAAEARAERRPECARVIETRSAEFERPEPVLSAEQRLLIDQQRAERAASTEGAARRLASNVGDPNSLEEQGVASIVLNDIAQPAPPPEPELPSQPSAAIIEAIVSGIQGSPPNP